MFSERYWSPRKMDGMELIDYGSTRKDLLKIKKCLKCKKSFNSYYGRSEVFCMHCAFSFHEGVCIGCGKEQCMFSCDIKTLTYYRCPNCYIDRMLHLLSPFYRKTWKKIKY